MFSDISGLSQINEFLNPETIKELLNGYYNSVLTSIEYNKGIVINIEGEMAISAFGSTSKKHEFDVVKSHLDFNSKFFEFLDSMSL